jgi:hypothetical protein
VVFELELMSANSRHSMDADEPSQGTDELRTLSAVLEALQKLPDQQRERVLQTVTTFFNFERPLPSSRFEKSPLEQGVSFSQDRSISPKEFLLAKLPRTDVERVACLAYYLRHYRDTPEFKTLDISTLNTEAAQLKFSNAAVALENASKQGYLVPASRGCKQISALGEQFILALPDREKAKAIMTNQRPRRRQKKQLSLPPEGNNV